MSVAQNNAFKFFLNVLTLLHFEYYTDAKKELETFLAAKMELVPQDTEMFSRKLATLLLDWVNYITREKNDGL